VSGEPADLGVEGGTVVSAQGRHHVNIYVRDGRVSAVTDTIQPAQSRVDASGLLVLPGMVDAHVHFMDPGALEREDFPTGSSAAAAAGVTTVIEHTHASPVIGADDLQTKAAYLRGRSRVDYALVAHAWPDRLEDARAVWAAGAAYLKAFTCTTHGVPGFDADALRGLFELAAEVSATCLVHCEDESLTSEAERTLRAAGRDDNAVIPEWRSPAAELTALETAMQLARSTGATAVAAHLSHPNALLVVERERSLGARVGAESCPQYFLLLRDEILEHGAFRKFTPPARARNLDELDAMWDALAEGRIDYVATDHAPATISQKQDGSIWDVHFGLPGIDTTLPLLLDAAHQGRLTYERVVEAYSEAPAKRYGFYPQKGALTEGADADLVLVDPTGTWEIRDTEILSRAGWSPYSGRTVTGRVMQTYLRGQLIAEDRHPAGGLSGQYLPGPGARREGAAS
jgi:dihydroorotase (multifunctional complex type)